MNVELSQQQRRILQLLSEGYGCQQIAKRIFLSPATVSTHISRIKVKLGADSTIQAAVMWARHLDQGEAEYRSWGKKL